MAIKKVAQTEIAILPFESISRFIRVFRGQQVILDEDIARLYGVPPKRLNEQVRRNRDRFPKDFMFRLTKEEVARLRSQIATLKLGRGQHKKYLSYAFTEQGVAMLSSVLKSKKAIVVNIAIMRSFVKMRKILASQGLIEQVELLKRKYGKNFSNVFEAIEEFKSLFETVYLLMSRRDKDESHFPIGF